MKFIDDQAQHNKVLFELGLLDDDDDWPLYQELQKKLDSNDPDIETYLQYLTIRN